MTIYSIGDVMKLTGLSRSTILYYEKKGLLKPQKDKNNLYRSYTREDLSRIFFFQSLKELDIEADEYATLKCEQGNKACIDMMEMILLKKYHYLKKISSRIAYVRYWDEINSDIYALERTGMEFKMKDSCEAWALVVEKDGIIEENRAVKAIMKNWNRYFLQRNMSYFFKQEDLKDKNYEFRTGLSCYTDCSFSIDLEIRNHLIHYPGRPCLNTTVQVDLAVPTENPFDDVFIKVNNYLEINRLEMCGDSWGHVCYRNNKLEQGKDFMSIWTPVKPRN
jgi:DNA-binding transcriptional MerR regulator